MNTPDRTTAAAFLRYAQGDVVADSSTLQWPGLYVRRFRFPRVVDRFLVPATAEPLISCVVRGQLEKEISVEALAALVELSPFHFSRVFKKTAGMSPLQFVTRERITRAQQLVRETERSLIEIALEVGYSSPSHFAQVFRKIVGVTPTEFRSTL